MYLLAITIEEKACKNKCKKGAHAAKGLAERNIRYVQDFGLIYPAVSGVKRDGITEQGMITLGLLGIHIIKSVLAKLH